MYESFFGFKEKPFNLTPDPRYLYLSPNHREALAHLVYGIQEKKGFTVITGEVGTGKTTLLYTLLEQHDSSVKAAFVFYPKLSFHDFLLYVLNNFGLETTAMTAAQGLMQLHQFLLEQHNKGETTVLVIDEAQNLPISLLEEIRMLSNLETAEGKLLQIALVGQPELQHKLRSPRLRQLRQRIGVSYEIRPLTYAEMHDYIQHRCAVAEGGGRGLFTRGALKAIYAYSSGIPRVINSVCDRALLVAYTEERRRVNRQIIRRVVHELEARPRRQALPRPVRLAATGLAGLVFLGLALFTARGLPIVSTAFSRLQASLQYAHPPLTGEAGSPTVGIPAPDASLSNAQAPQELTGVSGREEIQGQATETPQRLQDEMKAIVTPEKPVESQRAQEAEKIQAIPDENANGTSREKKPTFPVIRTMKEGDYVSKHAVEIYGYSSSALIALIQKYNPHIKDISRVKTGEAVIFPALDTPMQ